MSFELIGKAGRNDMIDLRYGEAIDDPQPFILTVTPQHVAHAMSKTLPISRLDMQDYVNKNAEKLKGIAQNCKARGFTSEVLQ
jgi:hypothetical protein